MQKFNNIAGNLAINFANTVLSKNKTEGLRSFDDIEKFLYEFDVLNKNGYSVLMQKTSRKKNLFSDGLWLRKLIRKILTDISLQKPLRTSLLNKGDAFIAKMHIRDRFAWDVRSKTLTIGKSSKGSLGIFLPIVVALGRLNARKNPIRSCANPTCPLFFEDTSKNKRRRWCSMSSCGNRAKVASFYKRREA